jgi:hypothetical protein
VLLAGVYKVTGVEHGTKHGRVVPARILGILIGTLTVAMIGVIAAQLWGRRVAVLAMFGAAISVPLILVGTYVAQVAEWTTRRMFELGGLDWSRHTASTISVTAGWANGGVICFWVFALLALARAFTSRARSTPLFVWMVPVLLYLSVVFLVVETPRYRTGIDPFVVMLAALALRRVLPGAADREPPPPDRARYPTSPKAPTPA